MWIENCMCVSVYVCVCMYVYMCIRACVYACICMCIKYKLFKMNYTYLFIKLMCNNGYKGYKDKKISTKSK